MTKLEALSKIKTKSQLVGWLVKNFSVEQLRSCLKSFKEEAVSPLRVEEMEQIGATVSGEPVYEREQTIGEACNPVESEAGIKECVKAITGTPSKWTITKEVDEEDEVFFEFISPKDKKYYTYDNGVTFETADGKQVKTPRVLNSLRNEFEKYAGLSSSFGKIQAYGARRNRYVTTVKKTPSGYKFLTYEFKNGKWNSKGTWKSAKSVVSGKPFSGKTTKTGLTNFFGLKDLIVDTKESGFGSKSNSVYPLKPLHPMRFGYSQKACNHDRTYGQLFPLGKYAYVDGPHRGVSSTFSEAMSKKRGLYPPPYAKIPNKWTYNQMQFGNSKFGMAPVNYNYTGPMDRGMFDSDNDLQLEATSYSFGKKRKTVKKKRKTVKKVTKKVVKKRKTVKKVTKKVVKKRKTVKKVTKKVVPKTLKTQAKRHGIKLTVKRGNKRVVKTEKVLRDQLKNKMKSKKRVVKKKSQKSKMKFGMKKRSKHCFGKKMTAPNDYGMVKSSYASDFPGIPNSMYGYRGTQPVFGGNTGVVGYSGLGNETIHLLPKTVTRNVLRRR